MYFEEKIIRRCYISNSHVIPKKNSKSRRHIASACKILFSMKISLFLRNDHILYAANGVHINWQPASEATNFHFGTYQSTTISANSKSVKCFCILAFIFSNNLSRYTHLSLYYRRHTQCFPKFSLLK